MYLSLYLYWYPSRHPLSPVNVQMSGPTATYWGCVSRYLTTSRHSILSPTSYIIYHPRYPSSTSFTSLYRPYHPSQRCWYSTPPSPRITSSNPRPSTTTSPSHEAEDELIFFALRSPTAITLKSMKEYGRSPSQPVLLMAGEFLRNELPVRLAHRVRDLKRLPFGLAAMPSIVVVRDLYAESFARIRYNILFY